jgi:hypothetical protein
MPLPVILALGRWKQEERVQGQPGLHRKPYLKTQQTKDQETRLGKRSREKSPFLFLNEGEDVQLSVGGSDGERCVWGDRGGGPPPALGL